MLYGRQRSAGPVDVEGQHRHRGTEWVGLAAPAALRRALERTGNLMGIVQGEDAGLEISASLVSVVL
jgi:hypothetical protein